MCVRNHKDDDHSSEADDEDEPRRMMVDDEVVAEDDRQMMGDDEFDGEQRKHHHRKCHCTKMSPMCFFETYDVFAFEPMDSGLRNDRRGKYCKIVCWCLTPGLHFVGLLHNSYMIIAPQ